MAETSVPRHTLGKGVAALEVPLQGFGCMGLSHAYSNRDGVTDEQKIALLVKIISLGINHLDTSDVYGPHTNELLIGRTLKEAGISRDKVIIATKFAISYEDGKTSIHGEREYVRKACLASLQRLGIDYIDLYYVHRIDQTVPIEDTMDELVALLKEGKIRHIGLSEASPETIRRAHAVYPLTAVQIEWSLWSRDVEEDIVPLCRELGIGIVAYSPIGRGFLSGKIKSVSDLPEGDWRRTYPRFTDEALARNVVLLETLEKKIAEEKKVPLGVVALAWVQHQGSDVVTIPGTTKEAHFMENFGSIFLQLTPEEVKRIGNALPLEQVIGGRSVDDASTYKMDKNPKRK